MNTIERLPDTELEIMKAIWSNPIPISTTQIKKYLDNENPRKEGEWNISALQTLLNRLIGRNFINSYKEGKNKIYIPIISENEYLAKENKTFLEKVNGNSITRFVTSLYDSNTITDRDLEELRTFIEERNGDKYD